MKKVAILQSNYIPWKGYFDLISYVDEFIIYDDMQFTKNDWRNRNKIKTPQGLNWITIPVGSDNTRRIRDVIFVNNDWRLKHCKTLEANYRKSPFFEEIFSFIKPILMDESLNSLTELNVSLIKSICSYLGILTPITYCWDYGLIEGKTERLVDLCEKSKADVYVSGPAAKDYIDQALFDKSKIQLEWFEYPNYSEYPQLWGEFQHSVSILDLMFNCGKESYKFMRYANATI
ncbi:WbqC family protein [Acinetobacter indicus]|uniref:WbqC family protein n=1 Tax=Acinetobacter indicus TaxID=756892 RepID=UPI0032B4BD02